MGKVGDNTYQLLAQNAGTPLFSTPYVVAESPDRQLLENEAIDCMAHDYAIGRMSTVYWVAKLEK